MSTGRSRCPEVSEGRLGRTDPQEDASSQGGRPAAPPHEPPLQARPWPASGPVWGGSQEDCPLWAVFGFRGSGGKWDTHGGTRSRPPAPFEGPWARRRRVAGLLNTKVRARPGHGLHPASRAQILVSLC